MAITASEDLFSIFADSLRLTRGGTVKQKLFATATRFKAWTLNTSLN